LIKLYNLKKILTSLTVFSVFFCYINFIKSSYTQPLTILFGFLALPFILQDLLKKIRLLDLWMLLIFALFGCFLFFIDFPFLLNFNFEDFDLRTLKNLATFISPILIVPSVFWLIDHELHLFNLLIRSGSVIWICVAFIQLTFDPYFMSGFAISQDVIADILNSGRGITGLAPESTHYGLFMLCISVSLVRLGNNLINTFLILSAVLLSFFSFSSSMFLILLLALFIYLLKSKPRLFFLLTFPLFFLFILHWSFDIYSSFNIRPIKLISTFFDDPLTAIIEDRSANARIGGLIASIQLIFKSIYSLPHGLNNDTWLDFRLEILSENDWLDSLSLNGLPSGYGILLFQGGIISLFIIMWIVFKLCDFNNEKNALKNILLISFPLIFIFQYYLSVPIFSLILGQAINSQKLSNVKRSIL
jgi:hypothetical protein